MKTKYRKVFCFAAEHVGQFMYVWNGHGYHRPIHTFNEIRQNIGDRHDLRGEPKSCQPRGRRSRCNLDAWNDEQRDRNYGKSWKHYTRHRKQWMVGGDPTPHVEYFERTRAFIRLDLYERYARLLELENEVNHKKHQDK